MNGSVYWRYTDEAHRDLVETWPELDRVLVRPTYEEAERAARQMCERVLSDVRGERCHDPACPLRHDVAADVEWIHHPPDPNGKDPLDAIGSWAWRGEC